MNPPSNCSPDYDGLLSFAQQSGLLDPGQVRRLRTSVKPQAAARALRSARELREALAATVLRKPGQTPSPGPPPSARSSGISSLRNSTGELHWQEAAAGNGQAGMAWQWGRFEKEAEFPVWILAERAAQLMLSRCDAAGARLRGRHLSLAVSRHEQESHASLVQHEGLREPHEGAQVPGASRSRALSSWRGFQSDRARSTADPERSSASILLGLRDLNSRPMVYKLSRDFSHIRPQTSHKNHRVTDLVAPVKTARASPA